MEWPTCGWRRSMPYSRARMAQPLFMLTAAPRPVSRTVRRSKRWTWSGGIEAVRVRESATDKPAMPPPTMATRGGRVVDGEDEE